MSLTTGQDRRLRKVSAERESAHAGAVEHGAAEGRRIISDARARAFSYKQADAAEAMLRYLARAEYREGGDQVLRSIPQIAKGLGKPTEGMTVRRIRDRYETVITDTLAYLERLGYVERVDRNLRRPDGQGIGILIHLRAGVAQSVRAARRLAETRPKRPRRPACGPAPAPVVGAPTQPPLSLASNSAPPRRGVAGNCSVIGEKKTRERLLRACARDRRSVDTPDRWSLSSVCAALRTAQEALGLEGAEPTGLRLLELRPDLATVPAGLLAQAAWQQAGHRDLRLSFGQREQLDTAAAQLERAGYSALRPGTPGAGAAAILDLALSGCSDEWRERKPGDGPLTPGALAICARRVAHHQLRGWRLRKRSSAAAAHHG